MDVPGHERFIKNMLAGATGIDLAVLVVAADDSVMPQTREHLEILRLLGLRHGVIALTKCDLVDADDARGRRAGNPRAGAGHLPRRRAAHSPPRPTPAHGLAELKAGHCRRLPARSRNARGKQWFRLAIDRSFIVQGHGTVVTGSVTSGSLAVGDEVEWLPRGERVRVRVAAKSRSSRSRKSIAASGRPSTWPASITKTSSAARNWPRPAISSRRRSLTVRLHCLADMQPADQASRCRCASTSARRRSWARSRCSTATPIEPGQWGLAQLFLDEPATATWGQPFVRPRFVGDADARRRPGAAAGGARRFAAGTWRCWNASNGSGPATREQRALTVAWFGGFAGFTLADLVRGANVGPDEAPALIDQLDRARRTGRGGRRARSRRLLLHNDMVDELEERILAALSPAARAVSR